MPPRDVSADRARASTQSDADRFFTCSDTWQIESAAGRVLTNRPRQSETLHAIERFREVLLAPLEREFGRALLTYGFADPELVKAVRARAAADGRFPRVHPPGDQHAGHEVGPRGARICKRDGFAVDLIFPGVSSERVVEWVKANLPFDRIYVYDADRPFHLSWAPEPVGQVVRMERQASGREVPRVVIRETTFCAK